MDSKRLHEIESNSNDQNSGKDAEIAQLRSQIDALSNAQRELENAKHSLSEQLGHKDNEINDYKSKMEAMSNAQKVRIRKSFAIENFRAR